MTIFFLALVVVIVVVGVSAITFRSRPPTSIDSGIQSFRREMNALAPPRPLRSVPSTEHTADDPGADSGGDVVVDEHGAAPSET